MTIRAKLLATLVPLALIAVTLMALLSRRAAERVLLEEATMRAKALAASFETDRDLAAGIARSDERKLLPILQQIARAGAAYAGALDRRDRFVAHTNVGEHGGIYHPPKSSLRTTLQGTTFVEVSVPVRRARAGPEDIFAETREPPEVGRLVIGVLLEPTLITARRIGGQVIAVVAAIMALNLVAAMALLRRTLAPIGTLLEGTRRLASGELGLTVPIGSNDEVGDLTASFNDMSRSLADVTVSKIFLNDILDNMLDALVVTDADGTIQMLNPSACRALNCRAHEWKGRPLRELLPQADMARQSNKPVSSGEAQIVPADGTPVPVLFSVSSLKSQAGGWALTFRDISARKAAEEALADKAAELERSNKELEQFAYIASHDLQEPLRKVANFTQLLERRYKNKLDAEADEFIGYIVDGSLRMRALIQDLLVYSRSGRAEAQWRDVDLKEVAESVLSDLEPALQQAKATVEIGALPVVGGDRLRLVQVFQNLIGNALKFRGMRECRVRVGAAEEADHWRLWIEDNGIGIPAEHRERVFVIFQRLHSRQEYPGTGIGLAICRRIIETHGGRIWVEDAAPGARFVFTLPKAIKRRKS